METRKLHFEELSPNQVKTVASILNHYMAADNVPGTVADEQTLPYFNRDYIVECLQRFLDDPNGKPVVKEWVEFNLGLLTGKFTLEDFLAKKPHAIITRRTSK